MLQAPPLPCFCRRWCGRAGRQDPAVPSGRCPPCCSSWAPCPPCSKPPPPACPALPQLKDKWGFRMTARYDVYAEQLARYVQHDFKPQLVRDPSLE